MGESHGFEGNFTRLNLNIQPIPSSAHLVATRINIEDPIPTTTILRHDIEPTHSYREDSVALPISVNG